MRREIIAAVSILTMLVFALAGCGARPKPPVAEEVPVNVVVSTVAPVTLPDAILLPAVVAPYKTVTVPVEASGAVDWLGVEKGARVKAGDVIARVEMRTLTAQLAQAQAAYDIARDNFERNEKLLAGKILSQSEYDQTKAVMDGAKAQLDCAQVSFDKGTVVAPASGILDERPVEVGEYVHPGDTVAEIIDIDRVKVAVDIPEKDVTFVKVGAPMGVIVNGGNADSILPKEGDPDGLEGAVKAAIASRDVVIGVVTYRSCSGDAATRTYRVEVTADNSDGRLLPGMIVRAVLVRRMIQGAITAPLKAIVPQEGRAVVYIVKDGRAVERDVELGVSDGRNFEITKGLAAGDSLVVEGQRQLKDGQLVKAVKPVASEGAGEAAGGKQEAGR